LICCHVNEKSYDGQFCTFTVGQYYVHGDCAELTHIVLKTNFLVKIATGSNILLVCNPATMFKLAYYRTIYYVCTWAQVLARGISQTEPHCGSINLNK